MYLLWERLSAQSSALLFVLQREITPIYELNFDPPPFLSISFLVLIKQDFIKIKNCLRDMIWYLTNYLTIYMYVIVYKVIINLINR